MVTDRVVVEDEEDIHHVAMAEVDLTDQEEEGMGEGQWVLHPVEALLQDMATASLRGDPASMMAQIQVLQHMVGVRQLPIMAECKLLRAHPMGEGVTVGNHQVSHLHPEDMSEGHHPVVPLQIQAATLTIGERHIKNLQAKVTGSHPRLHLHH